MLLGDFMNISEKAISIAKILEDYKGENVVVLDLSEKNTFTDYFIIASSSSVSYSKGLEKHVIEEAEKLDLKEVKKISKSSDGDEWKLIDLGEIVVHIMTPLARKFYELEKLWYDAKYIFGEK